MSMEAAGLLLDFAGVPGEGTTPRLAAAVDQLESYGPDERAAVELARLVAANHFDALTPARARDLVDVLAVVLGLDLHAGREHRLVEDLGPLPSIIGDLDARISALPTPGRLRRRIAEHAKGRRTKVADVPAGLLLLLAEAVERAEVAAARASGPTTPVDATEKQGSAGTGNAPAGPSTHDKGEAA